MTLAAGAPGLLGRNLQQERSDIHFVGRDESVVPEVDSWSRGLMDGT
jgi:hypothetical protein